MVVEIRKQIIVKLKKGESSMKVWTTSKKCFLLVILVLGFLGWSQGAQAQKYPTRTITLLCNNAPGAATDVGSRLIAQAATKILGQEIIVVNKTGGGGSIGCAALVNSKPDGYTLLGTPGDQIILQPHLEPVGYDVKDFTPIIQFGVAPVGIVVRSDSPYQSFKDLTDFARKNPGKVSYGPPNFGTSPHLAMSIVMAKEKVDIAIIPFTGSTPALTAVLGGHVSACGVSTSSFIEHLKAGKVKALATTSPQRIEAIPDAPTLSELGYPYCDGLEIIYMITAPKETPPDVVKLLEETFRKAMESPEFLTYAKKTYSYVKNPLSGQDLKEALEKRSLNYKEIVQTANLGKK